MRRRLVLPGLSGAVLIGAVVLLARSGAAEMRVEPAVARAGQTVQVRIEAAGESGVRGLDAQLWRREGERWSQTHYLVTSWQPAGKPSFFAVGEEGGWNLPAEDMEGVDDFVLPDVPPGEYEIRREVSVLPRPFPLHDENRDIEYRELVLRAPLEIAAR